LGERALAFMPGAPSLADATAAIFRVAGDVLLKFRLESNLRSLSENGSKNHDRCRPGVVRSVKILPGSLAWNYHVI
jgi:hypothetical protein